MNSFSFIIPSTSTCGEKSDFFNNQPRSSNPNKLPITIPIIAKNLFRIF
ncbi:hypothetical protein [Spiroplasma ixodetis]|nr:hypothetical protein [Spiroplasma ixodetis]